MRRHRTHASAHDPEPAFGRRERLLPPALLVLAGLLLAGGREAPAPAPATQRQPVAEIRVLTIDGVISPVSARYLVRELEAARPAGAVLVRLNTPGGLETAMRDMTEAILASSVPAIVYVTPPGGRAASAGMFVTLAAHVAAMAPGTAIGAARPVGLGGEADPELMEKIAEDAAALARSLAAARGRNAEWAERAVMEEVSITAHEALDEGVIDIVAPDLESLLEAVDGLEVETAIGPATIRTAGAPLLERPMTWAERILQAVTDPNIAYLLMTLGMIGLIAELYNPGTLFPGITGLIALILAFVALGSLPVGWAGIVLLLLGIGLLVAELYTEGTGFLAAAGIAAFVLGSLMLYRPITPPSPAALPDVRVSRWLVAGMALTIAAFFTIVLRALYRSRRMPIGIGAEAMVGRRGVAVSPVAPEGSVRIEREVWSAISEEGPIAAGEAVEVVGVKGVTLYVKPV
jgi:membrane-bound serine protease (ClpP class)